MSNIIISTSYANETVATKSYEALAATVTDTPVWILDNRYPLNRKDFAYDLAARLGFKYNSFGINVGCYDAYNWMIDNLPPDVDKLIGYDGDILPVTPNWAKACFDVIDDPTVGTCMLASRINQRELAERGFTAAVINGYNVKISHEVITCNTAAWSVSFLKAINGITAPHKYYGGNEIAMWKMYAEQGKKLVVLDDYWEDIDTMKALQDWQYEEYKLLYAHRGLGMSFEEYLKTNPVRHGYDNLIKEIFG